MLCGKLPKAPKPRAVFKPRITIEPLHHSVQMRDGAIYGWVQHIPGPWGRGDGRVGAGPVAKHSLAEVIADYFAWLQRCGYVEIKEKR